MAHPDRGLAEQEPAHILVAPGCCGNQSFLDHLTASIRVVANDNCRDGWARSNALADWTKCCSKSDMLELESIVHVF